MTIDWRPMTEWPPKKRHHSDQFLFWYPATTVGGRMAYSARAVADNAPTGGRTPTRRPRTPRSTGRGSGPPSRP